MPYIVVANLMSLLPWMLMAALPAATSSASVLTAMLVVQNIGAAMADVVVDAMVAESTNKDRYAELLECLCLGLQQARNCLLIAHSGRQDPLHR